jgi:hypothetical protein
MGLQFQFRLFRALMVTFVLAPIFLRAPRLLADEAPNEYELKAVMLFNLARFVEWPATAFASSNSPIVIGILGRNPFGNILEKAVQGETVNGRHLVIQYFEGVRDLKTCHILFICSNEKSRVSLILSKLKGQPILSVSEIEGFSRLPGGMVRFYTNDQNKIRLRLNLQAAHSEGLGVSSKLIQVAELDGTSVLWPHLLALPGLELAAWSAPSSLPQFAR